MDVFQAIKFRRSIRAYKDEPVSEEALSQVLEAARVAPSASNRQDHKFIVVKDAATRKALVPACNNQGFVGDAAVVVVGCTTNPSRKYAKVDVAIALDHMTLAATELGLGTCWIGAFSEEEVKRLLGIPENVGVVCLLPLGIPAKPGVPRSRKTRDELFSLDKWS